MLALKRLYPLVACAGIVMAAVATVVGQIDPDPHLDPLNLTIGEYAALDRGGAVEFAMASLGIGSFALVAGLRAAGVPVGAVAERLMLAWSTALVVIAIMPVTAPMYPYVSVTAFATVFVSMPVAGALMVTRFSQDEGWRAVARPMEWLALAGGFGLLAITYVALPGDRVLIGLAERVMLGTEIALVGVLAVRLSQLTVVRAIRLSPPAWVRATTRASRAALSGLVSEHDYFMTGHK
ncbi:hypothetical protein FHR32_003065 [Streptosporangium album]|uniref:DUF998 domain-containing protein n=1 Tax=Streptosporangium album TaxID=47479 RepID=A0A7W7WA43_9ACTN|nr:DUF998 domain-containing protein [Streptosporangium album]MBB4938760.1 hypothetical protein [Streptosporangium album]